MAVGFSFADGIVCPMINARRDRYFTAYFSVENGDLARLTDDDTLSGDEIEEYLGSKERPVYLTGDGVDGFLKSHSVIKAVQIPEMLKYPSAYYAGVIAKRIWDSSDDEARRSFTAESLRPI